MDFYRRIDFYISLAALFLVIVLVIYVFYNNYVLVQELNDISGNFQNHVRLTEPITSTLTDPKGFVSALSKALNDLHEFSEDLNQNTTYNFDQLSKQLESNNMPKLDVTEVIEPWNESRRRVRSKKKRKSDKWDNDSSDGNNDHKQYINDQVIRSRRNRANNL